MPDRIFVDTNILVYFIEALLFSAVDGSTIKKAIQVKRDTNYSYWDSLVIASALENNCSILYTEDMQDGQVIENNLTIVNPFKQG